MIEQKAHGHNEQHSSVLINPWRMHSTDLRSRRYHQSIQQEETLPATSTRVKSPQFGTN
jgi:hypothetical protein